MIPCFLPGVVFVTTFLWNHPKCFILSAAKSLRVIGLFSSSLLLYTQCFGRYVLQPSSGVCRTRVPTRNFEPRPLFNPRGSLVLIPLTITGYKCKVFLYCYSPAFSIEHATSRWLSHPELSSGTQSVTVIGDGALSFKRDNHPEAACSILTGGE